MYNKEMINQAVNLLHSKFDRSKVNYMSRCKARNLLHEVIRDFTEFANLNPDSNPAHYLFSKCDDFENLIILSNMYDELEIK